VYAERNQMLSADSLGGPHICSPVGICAEIGCSSDLGLSPPVGICRQSGRPGGRNSPDWRSGAAYRSELRVGRSGLKAHGWAEPGRLRPIASHWQATATKKGSRPISRVLSRTTIHLGRESPRVSSDLPGSPREPRVPALRPARFPIWSCSRWGLPCRRVLPPARCALTAPFHPYRRRIAAALGRSALCCTFRGLAPPRRYLAPCSAEPGLSSAQAQRLPGRLPAPL